MLKEWLSHMLEMKELLTKEEGLLKQMVEFCKSEKSKVFHNRQDAHGSKDINKVGFV